MTKCSWGCGRPIVNGKCIDTPVRKYGSPVRMQICICRECALEAAIPDDDSPEEVDRTLRLLGFDPEKIGSRMAAVAEAAYQEARMKPPEEEPSRRSTTEELRRSRLEPS